MATTGGNARMTRVDPVTAEELAQMETRARRYGPPNCWTGTSGTLAADVLTLVRELRRVARERDRAKMSLASLTTEDGGS